MVSDEWRKTGDSNPETVAGRWLSKPLQYHYGSLPKNNRMLFLLVDLCATITLLAGIEPDHWFGLKLKKVAGSILKLGAIDGTRTHLIRIDNPLPSPRTTMAKLGGEYWDRTSRARRRRIYSPLHHH